MPMVYQKSIGVFNTQPYCVIDRFGLSDVVYSHAAEREGLSLEEYDLLVGRTLPCYETVILLPPQSVCEKRCSQKREMYDYETRDRAYRYWADMPYHKWCSHRVIREAYMPLEVLVADILNWRRSLGEVYA